MVLFKHKYSHTLPAYGLSFLRQHDFSQRTTLRQPSSLKQCILLQFEKSRNLSSSFAGESSPLNSEIISDNVLSTGRETRRLCVPTLLGESDNHISLLSFLSQFYIYVKNSISLKHWCFPLTLPQHNDLFSGPNTWEDLRPWFRYSCYFPPIKHYWLFFSFHKNNRQKEEATALWEHENLHPSWTWSPFLWSQNRILF